MAVWISGTIVDDEGDFYFQNDRGEQFRIGAQVEDAYSSRSENPRLANGLKLDADINDRDRKVMSLRLSAAPKAMPKKSDFYNPYNFIPAPPFRPYAPTGVKGVASQALGLEQGPPAGHHRWHDERYSGRIEIEIKTITPLLIPDPNFEPADRDHKIYETLRDEKGQPVLPVTSFKGALRSAYEAITNSRMCVMDSHKITYRDPRERRRKEHALGPRDLLPKSLLPAISLDQLSPADRVFGWAHEDGGGAFRGQARIAPVRFVSGEGIGAFAVALPLAILGEPKPSQWLFYGAEDQTGKPLPQGTLGGAEGYKRGKGIRGRKTYPHQKAATAVSKYWDRTAALQNAQQPIDAIVDGDNPPALKPIPANAGLENIYREYVRRQGNVTRLTNKGVKEDYQRNDDNQNRSISDWVGPGSTFQTSIDVINLSREELGALLWLLDLNAAEAANPSKRYHLKLGGGKPLGFGSVEVRVVDAKLFTGRAKAKALAAFIGKPDLLDETERAALVADYRAWMTRHYGAGFKDISFIKAFLEAATGHDDGLATHYPRLAGAPDPVGENFRWFMSNSHLRGPKETLGSLATDPGLHYPKT